MTKPKCKTLTVEQLQQEYGFTKPIQKKLRAERKIRFLKLGHKTVLYFRSDIEKYLRSITVKSIGGGVA